MNVDPAVMFATGLGLKGFALYLVFAFGAASSLVWRPDIGLYLLALMLPLQTTRYHLHRYPLGANVVDIVLFCVLLGSVVHPQEPLERSRKILLYLVAVGVFYYFSLWRGSMFLGTTFPVSLSDARLIDFKNVMVMPVLAWAVTRVIRTRRQIATLLFCMGLSLLLVNWDYFHTAAGRDFSHYNEAVRDSGPLGYAGENGLAAYLAEGIVFLLPFVLVRMRLITKTAVILLAAISTYCLLYTYSRESYLAVVAGLLFLGVMRMRWLLIPLALLAVTWRMVLPLPVQERITMTYTSSDPGEAARLDSSAQERVDLLNDAMQLVREHTVSGTGFLTYAQMGRVGTLRDTHNYFLKMLVETGVPGLLIFAVQLFLFFYEGWDLHQKVSDSFLSALGLAFGAMMVATIVVNFFGDRWQYIQVTSNMWIVLGCVLAGAELARPVKKEEPAVPVRRWQPVRVPVSAYGAGGAQ